LTGPVALHGGGEYVAGDEPAMDALVAAGAEAAGIRDGGSEALLRIVLVPTAVARHRPDLAVAHGRGAFQAAAGRAGLRVRVDVAMILDRADASDPGSVALLEAAHVVHLPGGDPDLLPAVLRDTEAWSAILRAHARGACVAGASAGAMAIAERLWTRDGPGDGLGLVEGLAVLPHFDPARAATWRRSVDPDGRLTWLGLDERTLVIGRPGGAWVVAGAGRAHVFPPGAAGPAVSGGPGERLSIG
jgi:cyanophycinase-like exopeptidase